MTRLGLRSSLPLLRLHLRLARRAPRPGAPHSNRQRTRVPWLLASLVLLLLATNLLVEALDLRFHQAYRDERMNKVAFFQREVQKPAVVYLGSSQVHNGVMPALVEQEAARLGAPSGRGFNLGIGASGLEMSYVLARDVLKDDHRPDVLVVGVSALLLAAEVQERQVNQLSYGGWGDLASHALRGDLPWPQLATCPFRGAAILVRHPLHVVAGEPIRGSYGTKHLRQSQGGRWLPKEAGDTRQASAELWQAEVNRLLGSGFDRLTYHDDSRAGQLLKPLKEVARARGIHLVLVNLPQHGDMMKRMISDTDLASYRDWVRGFSTRHGIDYHDMSDPGYYVHEDFGDPVHLNASGAAKFSTRLARIIAAGGAF